MTFYTMIVERKGEIVKEKRKIHREGRCIPKMHNVKSNCRTRWYIHIFIVLK